MKISDYAVDHPVPVTIVVAVVVVFGVLAAASLTDSLFPDFNKPTINVIVSYPGASPEEMEDQVTSKIEEELAKVSDVVKISSLSYPSRAAVTLEFDWSVDVDAKLVDVRERLAAVEGELPDGVSGTPIIRKMNPNEMPILTVGIEGGAPDGSALHALSLYANSDVIPAISTIPGVASVDLVGKPERALDINLDLARLSALSVSPLEVAQAVSASNVVIPAGNALYGDSSANVSADASFSSLSQAENLVVGMKGRGETLRLADVAAVKLEEQEPERYVLVNGQRAVLVDVMAQSGADTVRIIREAKKRLAALSAAQGDAVRFSYYRDQSVSIMSAIASVRDSAFQGGLLAVVVLYFFLGSIGPTIIIALSIPFTIIVAFVALYLGGHSLNLMTLGGLTVAIGMIVDASIVMLEAIWRRADRGVDARLAAKESAAEMGGAIVASVLTSVVVFLPLVFVTGITGIVLRDIALTIIYALVGSVVAAVFIVPFLASLILGRAGRRVSADSAGAAVTARRERRGPVAAVQRGIAALESFYRRILDRALGEAATLIVAGVAVLILTVSLVDVVGFEFLADADTREMIVELDLPDGTPVGETRSVAERADELIAAAAPEAVRRVFYVGQGGPWSASATVSSHVYGFISLSDGGRSVFALIPVVREALESTIPDLKVSVRNGGNSEKTNNVMGGSGFRVALSGQDIGDAIAGARLVADLLRSDPEVASAEVSVSSDVLRITDRIDLGAAGALGVAPSDAAQTARIVFNGVQAGDFDAGDEVVPVLVRASVGELSDDLFHEIPVKARTGAIVPLSAFSSLQRERSVSKIPRENRKPTVEVVAELRGNDFRGVQSRMEQGLSSVALPAGTSWSVSGSAEETLSSFASLFAALMVGIFLVYAVMAIQFERYRQPLIVLSAIPFTLIGVILSLLVFGSSFSIVAFLGVISLAGVAVNNAIIMIDYTNLLRSRDGLPLREAIVAGASSRLRPILMTTLTTLLGVFPLAFATGGAATMAVLGQVILGGLATSTLITFFITPSLYWLTERAAVRRAEQRAERRLPRLEPPSVPSAKEVRP